MSRAHNKKRGSSEVSGDDKEAIYELSGGLHEDGDIEKRRARLLPPRRCPPWMKRDHDATMRFAERVNYWDNWLAENMIDMAEGRKKLEDISEDEIIGGLYELAKDRRRTTSQLAALKTLAEMKGMLGGSGSSDTLDERLDALLEAAARERKGRRGLRKVE